jgi:hypothetical protein
MGGETNDGDLPDTDGLSLLQYVDPYGRATYNRMQARDLLPELDQLASRARNAGQRRAVASIQPLAERCATTSDLFLVFEGD